MRYRLQMITHDGKLTVWHVGGALDRAARVAAPGLRNGKIRYARVVDDDGVECPYFTTITNKIGV
jgi:hypothetical protein